MYVFCLDVSHSAVETGYLKVFCDTLLDELEKLPGDSRTHIGFITYDRYVFIFCSILSARWAFSSLSGATKEDNVVEKS